MSAARSVTATFTALAPAQPHPAGHQRHRPLGKTLTCSNGTWKWSPTRRIAAYAKTFVGSYKEELRDLYRLPPGRRPDAHLDAWLARASRSRIPAVVDLSRTIRKHREQILAAVDLGLSNSKLEGLNSKIRLINHRGYGHHTSAAVIAMIYLCCSGLTITLPTGR
jgi:hypothetical protein